MYEQRIIRLKNEYELFNQTVLNSGGTLAIISTVGTPPHKYVVEYRCRGVERIQNSQPIFRHTHRVEIMLGGNFPREKPEAAFLTPIFHPNVFPSSKICLGNYWTSAETVSELVLRIGRIIQYSENGVNLNSPANQDAKEWALRNQRIFPVDTKTFKAAKESSSAISWNDLG